MGETKVYLCTESGECELKINRKDTKAWVTTIRSLCKERKPYKSTLKGELFLDFTTTEDQKPSMELVRQFSD